METELGFLLDPKYPSPSRIVRNYTAKNRPKNTRHSNHSSSKPADPLLRLWWADLSKNDECQGIKARPAHTLERSASDELVEGLREPTAYREG